MRNSILTVAKYFKCKFIEDFIEFYREFRFLDVTFRGNLQFQLYWGNQVGKRYQKMKICFNKFVKAK